MRTVQKARNLTSVTDNALLLPYYSEQREWLKFPRNAEDVQHLSMVLEAYLAQHYYQVLTCFITTYVS